MVCISLQGCLWRDGDGTQRPETPGEQPALAGAHASGRSQVQERVCRDSSDRLAEVIKNTIMLFLNALVPFVLITIVLMIVKLRMEMHQKKKNYVVLRWLIASWVGRLLVGRVRYSQRVTVKTLKEIFSGPVSSLGLLCEWLCLVKQLEI